MAYAAKNTASMSPLAEEWYGEVVKVAVAKHGSKGEAFCEGGFKDVEQFFLRALYAKGYLPHVSADYFRWGVALNFWMAQFKDLEFPLSEEMPAKFGSPCCQQYVEYWYARRQAEERNAGDVVQVPSAPELTSTAVREKLLEKLSLKKELRCEALELPVPIFRAVDACFGEHDKMEAQLSKASASLGPEFVLYVRRGGKAQAKLILGLCPGVDADSPVVVTSLERAFNRLRDWYMRVLEKDCDLADHLEQAPPNPELESQLKAAVRGWKRTVAAGSGPELESAACQAQADALNGHAYELVAAMYNDGATYDDQAAVLDNFIENGHKDVYVLEKQDRVVLVQPICFEMAIAMVKDILYESATEEDVHDRLSMFVLKGDPRIANFNHPPARLAAVKQVWQPILQQQGFGLCLRGKDLLTSLADTL